MLQSVLCFAGGGLATVRMGGLVGHAGGSHWVSGTEGTLTFDQWDGPVTLHRPGAAPEVTPSDQVCAYTRELEDFLVAVEKRGAAENSPLNGLRNVALGLALYRSLETGQPLDFDDGLPVDLDADYQYRGPSSLH
jgi:predicted dehydrogenase